MEDHIQTRSDYEVHFDTKDKRKKALEYALDIRKFEIELYWKRAAYFWTLIVAAFGGYFSLNSVETPDTKLVFMVGCIGTVLSVGWFLANRGSKYWQENWESHVDTLQEEFIGPLYRTTIAKNRYSWWNFWDGYPYSVSRINQVISLFIALLWIGITVSAYPGCHWPQCFSEYSILTLAIVTCTFILLLLFQFSGRSSTKARTIDLGFIPLTQVA